MSEELMITKEDLVNWLNRPPSNDDLDLIGFITTRLESFYKLEQENKQLKEENERLKEIENLKNIISSIKEDYLIEKAKIDKILDYLDTKFMQGLNYSEWTDGYNECIKRHKSNFQNILQGDD